MNWETLKHSKDAVLDGVTIEIEKADNSFVGVTFTDASGHKLHIRMTSYSMVLEIPAKPKTEKKYALTGEFKGIRVDEKFESEYEANKRHRELDTEDTLTVAEVECEIPF